MTNLEKKLFVDMVNEMINKGITKDEIQLRLSQHECNVYEINEILEASNYYKYNN